MAYGSRKRQRTAALQNLSDFAMRLGVRQSSAAFECLALILTFLTTLARAAEIPSVESLVAKTRDSVVVVSQFGRDGKEEGVGAGFVISSNLIGTAMHVIGESRRLSVRIASGKELEASEIHAWDR